MSRISTRKTRRRPGGRHWYRGTSPRIAGALCRGTDIGNAVAVEIADGEKLAAVS